jgi:hypothetical protein
VPRAQAVTVVLLAALFASAAACVVETEPAPPKRLLRDMAPPPPAVVASASPLASAPVPPDPPAAPVPVAPPVPDAFRACTTDTDCAAVLRNGCCQDGRNEPVNKSSVDAYKSSFTCPTTHPICPMHVILDHRVPACDAASHMCILVEPKTAPE